MIAPIWIEEAVVIAIHRRQLAEHGGSDGIRDKGLLESALFRPKNQLAYGNPTIFALAAAYGYGITKNHPFIDGNKRTSIGSGAVESAVKQIAHRVKLTGAQWKKENVPHILQLRCTYLNGQLAI